MTMMTRVLIADSDDSLATAMMRSLGHFGIEAVACSSPSAARAQLGAQSFDLLIIDERLTADGGVGGAGIQEGTPTVLTASFVGPFAARSGVRGLTLLHKPYTSLELLCVVQRALGRSSVRPASTVDALRRAHSEKSSLCLCVRPERRSARPSEARIYVELGEVVHAVSAPLEGVAAFKEILRRRGPVIERPLDVIPTRSIQRPFKPLIFDILQELDMPLGVSCRALPSRPTGHETVED
jgi:hypothetical protein